jgi:hypothetical protein
MTSVRKESPEALLNKMQYREPHGSWHSDTEGISKMANFHVTLDALVFAVPMVLILFAVFFRLDELIVRPKVFRKRLRKLSGHDLSGWDKEGHAVCVEPDGHIESLHEVKQNKRDSRRG